MSNKIKGLTLEIGGETTLLTKSLGEVNKHSRDLKSELRDVERLLKLDPKNTELLSQKQKLLAESVENTKKKLDTLKDAERQAQEQFARGEIGEEQYRAIQREVIKTEQELQKLESRLGNVGDKWKSASDKVGKFGDKAVEVGKGMTAKVTAPILAVGAASILAFKEVDGALDTIVTKTGATGEVMEGLEQSFRNVAKTMPADLQTVGDAIGEINTQFAFTGEALETASKQMIKFAEINGQDVTSSSIDSKNAMEAFGLSASDLDLILDSVTKTAQNTGVGTDKIFDSVVKGAPQLKALGLDFAQSAEMMGRFEQKGLESTKALSYMARAQVGFAKDGKTLDEGMAELTKRITTSTSETEKLTLASEYFGTKGASFMLEAIERGALDFDDLANAAENAGGSVTATFEGAQDPIDKFSVVMNNIKIMGADIATTLQEVLAPALEGLVENVQVATDWFANMSPAMQEISIIVALVAASIGPLLIFIGKMATGLSAIMELLAPLIAHLGAGSGGLGGVIGALSGPIGWIILAIVAFIGILVALWKTNEEFRDNVKQVWEQIQELFKVSMEAIQTVVTTIYDAILKFWEKNGETIKKVTGAVWGIVADRINAALKVISGFIDVFIGLLTGDWDKMGEGIKKIWEGMWATIVSRASGIWQVLSSPFDNLGGNIKKWFDNLIKNAYDWGKNLIKGFIDGIGSMVDAVGTAVSKVTTKAKEFIGFNSPSKKGEGRNIEKWGYNMIDGFIDGMNNALPELEASLRVAIPNMSGGNTSNLSTSNSFIVNAVIREESDIRKVAQELHGLQQMTNRGRGLRA